MNEIVLVCECGAKHKVTSFTISIVCMVCKRKYDFEGKPSPEPQAYVKNLVKKVN